MHEVLPQRKPAVIEDTIEEQLSPIASLSLPLLSSCLSHKQEANKGCFIVGLVNHGNELCHGSSLCPFNSESRCMQQDLTLGLKMLRVGHLVVALYCEHGFEDESGGIHLCTHTFIYMHIYIYIYIYI